MISHIFTWVEILQIFGKLFLDEIILDFFSGVHTVWRKSERNLEITTDQNVYLSGDLRYLSRDSSQETRLYDLPSQ